MRFTIHNLRLTLSAISRCAREGCEAESLNHSSRGQRPRNAVEKDSLALKGQTKASGHWRGFGMPFQGAYHRRSITGGVAPGYYGPAPSAREAASTLLPRRSAAKTGQRFQRGAEAAFTMMEIAISLAVIGIALVAIIGVLPLGMNVQQANREETIVGQDANVLMEAVRNGSLGYDDLTNYVYAVSNYWAQYSPIYSVSGRGISGSSGTIVKQGVNGYTYANFYNDPNYPGYLSTGAPGRPLTNAANIIGLLSTPEYTAVADNFGDVPGQPIPSLEFGGISNHIVAYCYSISGPAIQKPPQDNQILQQDSFGYHIYCVNAPTPIETNIFFLAPVWLPGLSYPAGSEVFYNWMYWGCPSGAPPRAFPGTTNVWQMSSNYTLEQALNLHELRLTFEWPKLANGNVGSSRETFRTEVAGQLVQQPPLSLNSLGQPVNSIWYNPNLYCYLPETFTNTP